MIEMTDKELKDCKDFLDNFGVDYTGDYIELTSGGNSCIMNPNTKWKEFLGCSVNSVSEAVAKKLEKKTKWIYDDYDDGYDDPL